MLDRSSKPILSSMEERENRRSSFVRKIIKDDSEELDENSLEISSQNVQKNNEVINVSIDILEAYHNHPFLVKDDEEMDKLVDSIKESGIIYPVLVRPIETGGLEIVAGHRRVHAAKLAGLTAVPAIIKELNDEQADITMVDTNIQRENILYSEKAFAYKIKMDAMKRQGKKSDCKIDTADEIGEAQGDSKRTVFRYIRLTYLIKELLDLVDSKKIPAFTTGLSLSYLTVNEQNVILEFYKFHNIIPTPAQAAALKSKHIEFSKNDSEFTSKDVLDIFENKKKTPKKIVIKEDKITKYFPETATVEDIENKIIELLEAWKEKENE